MMTAACPTPDRLLGFASGELTDDQAASIEAHIDSCTECRAALSNLAQSDVPSVFGRYRIDTVLGSGGMGIVYRAYDPQLARAIAIKVVKRAADDEVGRARLIREAQSLARLSHPNVCHVYDVGTQDDEVWVAMELIDGVSLREWPSQSQEARDDLLEVLLGAAEGIAAAHEAGLVHRDIKPENVLVTRDGRAIVTDFGLARGEDVIDPNASTLSTDPHLTATGAIAGTPAYLAPEQLTGDPIDQRVDQFAWAVMAWELITGGRPFPIIFALRVDAVRAGLTPPPSLDKQLAAALSRAMQANARDRFPTMRELIAAIREPAPAVHRGRTAAIAGAVVLAAAAAVGIGAWRWPQHEPEPPQQATIAPALPVPVVAPPIQPAPAVSPPVAVVPPVVAPAPTRPAPIAKTVVRQVPKKATPAPPPPEAPKAVMTQPQPATPPTNSGTQHGQVHRANAIASMDAFCRIPYDAAHPDPALKGAIVDWGRVTKVETEAGTFNGDDLTEIVLTVAGQRGTIRFTDDSGPMRAKLNATVGQLVAYCGDREPFDLYHLTGGPIAPTEAVVTLSGVPRITEVAKLKPLHIPDIQLAAAGSSGRWTFPSDRRYIVNAKVDGAETTTGRWKMDRYTLEVPEGIRGGSLITAGKRLWIVVEDPHFEDVGDGKKKFVVRAAAVLEDMFP